MSILITPATETPVSLIDVKAHLRIDHTDDDVRIARMLSSAVDRIEARTGRRLVTQTREMYLAEFSDEVKFTDAPLISVTSVKYLAPESSSPDWHTLSASAYRVDNKSEPGRILLADGQAWPSTRDQENSVAIRYVVGYGAASAVPANFKDAILLACETLYDRNQDRYIEILDQAIDGLVLKDRLFYA